MRKKILRVKKAALKLPTDPPKSKPNFAVLEPLNARRDAQREYNQRRNRAEDEFLQWFHRTEGELPSFSKESLAHEQVREAEYKLEMATRERNRLRDLRHKFDKQQEAWLAAQGIAPSWTEQKKGDPLHYDVKVNKHGEVTDVRRVPRREP